MSKRDFAVNAPKTQKTAIERIQDAIKKLLTYGDIEFEINRESWSDSGGAIEIIIPLQREHPVTKETTWQQINLDNHDIEKMCECYIREGYLIMRFVWTGR